MRKLDIHIYHNKESIGMSVDYGELVTFNRNNIHDMNFVNNRLLKMIDKPDKYHITVMKLGD